MKTYLRGIILSGLSIVLSVAAIALLRADQCKVRVDNSVTIATNGWKPDPPGAPTQIALEKIFEIRAGAGELDKYDDKEKGKGRAAGG